MRERLAPHALFWGVAWPALAAVAASLDVAERKLYPFAQAMGLSGLALGVLLPQLLVAVVLLSLATAALFGLGGGRGVPLRVRLFEPLVFGVALFAAAALRFPALLHHPFLLPLRPLPAWAALAALTLFALGLLAARALEEPVPSRRLGRALAPAGAALALGLFGGGTGGPPECGARDSVFLIGLDSVAASDVAGGPLGALAADGGKSFSRAVAPALLTNAVWASILLEEPPGRHGVLLGLQDWSLDRSAPTLTQRAKTRGLETVAVFPNRSTTWVGARGGFDADRGGALGWRQMSTAWIKNAGVVLPLLLPLLPEVPGAATPRNQVDTFAYDLASDLEEVFAGGETPRLVAAHLTYLHESRYPSFAEMGPEARRRVLGTPAGLVWDDSFDWLHEDAPDAPVPLRAFKWRQLQEEVAGALRTTGVLDPARGNVVVVFADHGPRFGLKRETFRDPRYWHVPLLVWGDRSGLPAGAPISLVEIGKVAGLVPSTGPAALPRVTFAEVTAKDWKALVDATTPRSDGTVELPAAVVADVSSRAETYAPAEEGPWPGDAAAAAAAGGALSGGSR